MTLADLEERLSRLEKEFRESKPAPKSGQWWIEQSGQFRGDPLYKEMVRLGRKYRESLRPKARSRRK